MGFSMGFRNNKTKTTNKDFGQFFVKIFFNANISQAKIRSKSDLTLYHLGTTCQYQDHLFIQNFYSDNKWGLGVIKKIHSKIFYEIFGIFDEFFLRFMVFKFF
jgi:hypothetical protein